MGERSNQKKITVGKPEGKRPLGRPRYRWDDNNKMDHKIKTKLVQGQYILKKGMNLEVL
jgi:hypothetical protein